MKSQPLNMVFYQLDWPPERVPPLIELVSFLVSRSRNRRSGILNEHGVKQSDDFVHLGSIDQPSDPER